jgi:hypothetical protein
MKWEVDIAHIIGGKLEGKRSLGKHRHGWQAVLNRS